MKLWYKSKTVWIGIIQLVIAVSTYGIEFMEAGPNYGEPMTWLLLANGITMIILRSLTTAPIKLKKQS